MLLLLGVVPTVQAVVVQREAFFSATIEAKWASEGKVKEECFEGVDAGGDPISVLKTGTATQTATFRPTTPTGVHARRSVAVGRPTFSSRTAESRCA